MDNESVKSESSSFEARVDKLIHDLNPKDNFTKGKSTPQKKSQINKNEKKYLKKENISLEEASKINKAICEYAFINGFTSEEIINQIHNLKPNYIETLNNNSLFNFISKSIPNRSIKIIYNYCLSNFSNTLTNNNNNTHNNNINDFKKLKNNLDLSEKENSISETSSFSLENKLSLIREINIIVNIQYFLDLKEKNKIKLIKNKFEFVPNIDLNGEIYTIDKTTNKIKIDEVFKISKSHNYKNFFIRNIFDFAQIVNLIIKNIEINWEIIGKKMKVNPNQCKNDWEKIKREYKVDQLCKIRQDIIMVKKYLFKNKLLYILN